MRFITINKFFLILSLVSSLIFSEECGNNICSELESYINCIEDCPVSVDKLFWFNDVSVHVDSNYIIIPLKSIYLENLIAIQFKIQYDENLIQLNTDNCNGNNQIDCEISNPSLSYLTNTSNPGIIEGII